MVSNSNKEAYRPQPKFLDVSKTMDTTIDATQVGLDLAKFFLTYLLQKDSHHSNLCVKFGQLQVQCDKAQQELRSITKGLDKEMEDHEACEKALSEVQSQVVQLESRLNDNRPNEILLKRIQLLENALREQDLQARNENLDDETNRLFKRIYELEGQLQGKAP